MTLARSGWCCRETFATLVAAMVTFRQSHSLPPAWIVPMNNPTLRRSAGAKLRNPVIVGGLFAVAVLAGCASTTVTQSQTFVTGPLPRPGHIWVYDFVSTPADVPTNSVLARQNIAPARPQTAAQIAAGRKVGAEIATELARDIRSMGLPADRAFAGARVQVNDIVIRGYILSLDEGSAVKRLTIGFGSGKSELRAAIEGFQVTARGLRRLESRTVEGDGSKVPGGAVGLAALAVTGNPVGLIVGSSVRVYAEASGRNRVEGRARQVAQTLADQLKPLFQEQCWVE